MRDQDDFPLKVFMKEIKNETPLTGYFNKKKKIFYYKSRNTGSNVSINAKILNKLFIDWLSIFEFESNKMDKLKQMQETKISNTLENNKIDKKSK
jgi:hypothetical protein